MATSASRMPNRPEQPALDPAGRDLGDHREDPVGDLVELHALVEVLGERLVDDGDRADPADRLHQRLPPALGVDPAGLEPEQGGHRLEVVLHPVVDLPDGGVLGHQLAFAAAQFRDVAEKDQRTDVGALGPQRDGPELDDTVAPLHLRLARRPPAGQLHHRLVDRAPGRGQFGRGLAQVVPDQVGGEAEPVVRREGVRGGVLDDAVGVQADQAVSRRAGRRRCRPAGRRRGSCRMAIICARSEALWR